MFGIRKRMQANRANKQSAREWAIKRYSEALAKGEYQGVKQRHVLADLYKQRLRKLKVGEKDQKDINRDMGNQVKKRDQK